ANYQELKKITKWDGKIHTLVSRYALRYSILETGNKLKFWDLAEGSKLKRAGKGDKTVIQPSTKVLLSGEILKYPEFDLFGYLVTDTTPQNWREAPVKISHAISMTPYNYDAQFAGNLGLAKRMIEAGVAEKMDPNLFTVEEHQTYYIYTIVIDVDRVGKMEVYLAKDGENDLEDLKVEKKTNKTEKKSDLEDLEDEKETNETEKKSDDRNKEKSKYKLDISIKENKIILTLKDGGAPLEIQIPSGITAHLDKKDKIFAVKFEEDKDSSQKKIKNLIKTVLKLKRSIKGREEFLEPKLLVIGCYKGSYRSFKDQIILSNEYEEIYEEDVKEEENGRTRIVRRIAKLNKPTFIIKGLLEREINVIEENVIDKFVENFLQNQNQENKVKIFKSPEIEVKFE
ncbi:MAG: type I-B CRISPR-associated protein Cas7/Cst2/DevR, partial [Candidatus Ratteibacteria bacterium]